MSDDPYEVIFERRWRARFPAKLSGLFAFYQCLCTAAIIGCEVGSIVIDLFNASVFVGFWASIFFTIAWVLQTIGASCRRNSNFGMCVLVFQSIALFFAACVIIFDAYFVANPKTCLFSRTLCNSTVPTRGVFYSEYNFDNIKMPLIKGQLGIAAVMFAFSIDYIIIDLTTRIYIEHYPTRIVRPPTPEPPRPFSMKRSIWHTDDVMINNSLDPMMSSSLDAMMNRNDSTLIDSTYRFSLMKSFNRSRWSADSADLSPIEV